MNNNSAVTLNYVVYTNVYLYVPISNIVSIQRAFGLQGASASSRATTQPHHYIVLCHPGLLNNALDELKY